MLKVIPKAEQPVFTGEGLEPNKTMTRKTQGTPIGLTPTYPGMVDFDCTGATRS